MKYRPSNRERSREPRGRSYWCFSCDGTLIAGSSKCRQCGYKGSGKKRFKAGKSTPLE